MPVTMADQDTMYLREALQQPDKEKILEAILKDKRDRGPYLKPSLEKY